jgi:hypothetical protein
MEVLSIRCLFGAVVTTPFSDRIGHRQLMLLRVCIFSIGDTTSFKSKLLLFIINEELWFPGISRKQSRGKFEVHESQLVNYPLQWESRLHINCTSAENIETEKFNKEFWRYSCCY